jgi:DNA-binding MarR family transcriptional regulator
MKSSAGDADDAIDLIRRQWRRELPTLDTSAMETIGRVLRAEFVARNRIRKELAKYDLDLAAFDVLATLRRAGQPYRLTATQLYRELALTSGGMSHRMDSLEKAGLLERVADPDDRRGVLASLTRRGQLLIERAMTSHLRLESALAGHLSAKDQADLAGLLKKLLLSLERSDA